MARRTQVSKGDEAQYRWKVREAPQYFLQDPEEIGLRGTMKTEVYCRERRASTVNNTRNTEQHTSVFSRKLLSQQNPPIWMY